MNYVKPDENMLLAIDIGNTNISLAIFDKSGKIVRRFHVPANGKTLRPVMKKISGHRGIGRIIVASVAPRAFGALKVILKSSFTGIRPFVVGHNLKVPIECLYNKRQIGQDRLVTAYAAKLIYGLPALIIDFGTAVTFDAVSKRGAYLGGLILPGIKMSLESLREGTAMLPKVDLGVTSTFIGRNTESSIQNGMIYGYSAICKGLIDIFKRKVSRDIKVVCTGGDAPLIARYTPSIKRVDIDLSLKGLYLLSK
ncbi:MAG: type III pantothenate kinase [Candidatus Omnitrophota bacterium]